MSIRVKIQVPKKKQDVKSEEMLFRDDETGKQVVDYIIKQFQLTQDNASFKLFFPRGGCYIKKTLILRQFHVKDEDTLELHEKKNVDKVNVVNASPDTVSTGSAQSLQSATKSIKFSMTEPLYKIVPNIIKQFNFNGKDEYSMKKINMREDTGVVLKIGKYLNVNLSCKEQNVKRGGYIFLEPLSFSEKTYESVAKSFIRKEGYVSKNSKKGDGKVTGLKKRWAVLQDNFLYYFQNNKPSTKASGVIDLEYMILSKDGSTDLKLESIPSSFRIIPHTYGIVTDNEKERNEWYAALKHHSANGDYRRIFGVSLEKLLKQPTKTLIVVTNTINHLDDKCLDTEGLFRTAGNPTKVEFYKEEFNSGKDVNFADVDPHVVAGLLKVFLKELPEPLLTHNLYKKFLSVETLPQLQECISALPVAHQLVLEVLVWFWGRVLDHKQKNGLDIATLSYTFAPAVLQPKQESVENAINDQSHQQKVVKMMIENRYNLKFAESKGKKRMNLKNLVQVKALYDYASQGKKNPKGEIDLGFQRGDIMLVIEEPTGSAWYKVRKGSEEGLVPNNYVQKVAPGELKISKLSAKSAPKGTVRDNRKSKKLTSSVKVDEKRTSKSEIPTMEAQQVDWKGRFDQEQQLRMKLELEIADLKSRLFQYEQQYGPMNSADQLPPPDTLPPPPSELPPPPM